MTGQGFGVELFQFPMRRVIFPLLIVLCLLTGCAGQPAQTPAIAGDVQATAIHLRPTADPAQMVFYVSPSGDDANPGTQDAPWRTVNHAARTLTAGQTVYIKGGTYNLTEAIQVAHSGREDAWITFAIYPGYPGEQVVLDASNVRLPPAGNQPPYPTDLGAFLIRDVSYIRVHGIRVRRSYNAGFNIRDSHHVEITNCATDTTFGPGISVWDTDADGLSTHHILIANNRVTHANTWDMLPPGMSRQGEPPHEAISIAGATHFEVAYNLIHDTDKEGIDIKEVSKHGTVHHNVVRNADRQGIYVDAWFGAIEDIEIYENVMVGNRGAGFIISVENGESVSDVRFHHNLIYNNLGSGIFFSRWGDGPRSNIQIYNNTIYHNGWGTPDSGKDYFWLTGGLYLFSNNLSDIDIRNNIFADNRGFEIGVSDHWLAYADDIATALEMRNIQISYNLFHDTNAVTYPIRVGWEGNYADVFSYRGKYAIEGDPLFINPATGDFHLAERSPAVDRGSPGKRYLDPDGSPNDLGAFWRERE